MPKSRNEARHYSITISEKLRGSHPWFESGLRFAKEESIAAKRKSLCSSGPKLSSKTAVKYSDELERIQRSLNPLFRAQEKILKKLRPHWGHTGLEKIAGKLGITRIHQSFTVTLTESNLQKRGGILAFLPALTETRLIPEKVMQFGDTASESMQKDLLKAVDVKARINIVPPSSQPPKKAKKYKRQ